MGKPLIDLNGQVFGRWTVLEQAESYWRGGARWLCRCECGTEKIVLGKSLSHGLSKSCGCLSRDIHRLPEGQAAFNSLYVIYKLGAKKHNRVFELTKEDFSFITKMNCHYCGVEPKQIYGRTKFYSTYTYNGIDRLNNSKGYTLGNVVPCCKWCNISKGTRSVSEFIEHVRDIVNCRGG